MRNYFENRPIQQENMSHPSDPQANGDKPASSSYSSFKTFGSRTPNKSWEFGKKWGNDPTDKTRVRISRQLDFCSKVEKGIPLGKECCLRYTPMHSCRVHGQLLVTCAVGYGGITTAEINKTCCTIIGKGAKSPPPRRWGLNVDHLSPYTASEVRGGADERA